MCQQWLPRHNSLTNHETGIIKYLELELNAHFVKPPCRFSLPIIAPQRLLDTDESFCR